MTQSKSEQNIFYETMFYLIEEAIKIAAVSVYNHPDGNFREYSFDLFDGQKAALETVNITNQKGETATQFNIFVEEKNISSVIIPKNRKIYSPEELRIIKLFNSCASKVIFQEMNTIYTGLAGKLKNKTYNS